MNLTKIQKKAVTSNSYPFFLRASAGTGKTEVLIQKIGHIVARKKKSLENFAVITFTNKATDEMRERLYKELYNRWAVMSAKGGKEAEAERLRYQAEICSMVQISTIHGFCDKILRTYGMDAGISPAFRVASFRQESQKIIMDVLNKYRQDPAIEKIPQYKIISFITMLMNDNNNRGIVVDERLLERFQFDTPDNEYFNALKRTFLRIYVEAYELIEKEKTEANILTLNDTIKMTADILGKPDIAKKIAAKYRFLFIDEIQDVDKRQFDIVTTLINFGTKVFIVGDEKQSIFRFRGADVRNIAFMQDKIDALQSGKLELNENFRADEALTNVINRIFSVEYSFKNLPIHFPRQPFAKREVPLQTATEMPFEMVYGEDIVKTVRRIMKTATLNGNPVRYDDIAILCKRNLDVDAVAGLLKSNDIPVEALGGKGFYKSKEIIDTYRLLNAAIYKSDEYADELMFTDYFQALTRCGDSLGVGEFLLQLDTVLRRSTIENALSFAFEKSNILEYYRYKCQYQAIANLYKLKNIARELLNTEWIQPIGFLNYLEIMIKTGREEDEAEIPASEKNKGVISTCSIHKAKGLSFPIVIIPYSDRSLIRPIHRPKIIFDSSYGDPRLALDSKELNNKLQFVDKDYNNMLNDELISHLEEELRIMYVALTRAKHKIIISSVQTKAKIAASKKLSWSKWLISHSDI